MPRHFQLIPKAFLGSCPNRLGQQPAQYPNGVFPAGLLAAAEVDYGRLADLEVVLPAVEEPLHEAGLRPRQV